MLRSSNVCRFIGVLVVVLVVALAVRPTPASAQMTVHSVAAAVKMPAPSMAQIRLGRALVLNHGCAGCHGGHEDPSADGYLAGITQPDQEFLIGPCANKLDAQPCWHTRPRNITPDNTTGIGRFSERQIFNALRYGLRPGETPDVAITSSTPGQGNFPSNPRYLAPPMPWPAWRYMSDPELWAIAAYLKHAVKPVKNVVRDSEGPPDFWASVYTVDLIGPYPLKPFPTAKERLP